MSWKDVLRARIQTVNFEKFGTDEAYMRNQAIERAITIAEQLGIGPVLAERYASTGKHLTLDASRQTDLRGNGGSIAKNHRGGIDLAVYHPASPRTQMGVWSSYMDEAIMHEFAHELDLRDGGQPKYSTQKDFIQAHSRDSFRIQVVHAAAESIGQDGIINEKIFSEKYSKLAADYNQRVDMVRQSGGKNTTRNNLLFNDNVHVPNNPDVYFEQYRSSDPQIRPHENFIYGLYGDPAEIKARGLNRQQLESLSRDTSTLKSHVSDLDCGGYEKDSPASRTNEVFAQGVGIEAGERVPPERLRHLMPEMSRSYERFRGDIQARENVIRRKHPEYFDHERTPPKSPLLDRGTIDIRDVEPHRITSDKQGIALAFPENATDADIHRSMSQRGFVAGQYAIGEGIDSAGKKFKAVFPIDLDAHNGMIAWAGRNIPEENWHLNEAEHDQAKTAQAKAFSERAAVIREAGFVKNVSAESHGRPVGYHCLVTNENTRDVRDSLVKMGVERDNIEITPLENGKSIVQIKEGSVTAFEYVRENGTRATIPQEVAPRAAVAAGASEAHAQSVNPPRMQAKGTAAGGLIGLAMGAKGLHDDYANPDSEVRQDLDAGGARAGAAIVKTTADATGVAAGAVEVADDFAKLAKVADVLDDVGKVGQASKVLKAMPVVGTVTTVLGGAASGVSGHLKGDGHKVAQSIGSTGGAIAGGIAGAQGGAALGAAIGVWFGGVGAVPGAFIGGIVGGIGGAIGGAWAGGEIADAAVGDAIHNSSGYQEKREAIAAANQPRNPEAAQDNTITELYGVSLDRNLAGLSRKEQVDTIVDTINQIRDAKNLVDKETGASRDIVGLTQKQKLDILATHSNELSAALKSINNNGARLDEAQYQLAPLGGRASTNSMSV